MEAKLLQRISQLSFMGSYLATAVFEKERAEFFRIKNILFFRYNIEIV